MSEEEKTRILREYKESYAAMLKAREEYDRTRNRWKQAYEAASQFIQGTR